MADTAVDAGRFEAGLADGRDLLARDPVAALDRLDAALGEWRGDAFAEFAETEWIRPEAVRLEELRLVAAEVRIDAQLRVGRHHEVVGEVDGAARRAPAARAVRRGRRCSRCTGRGDRPRRCGSRSSSAPRCATTSGSNRRPTCATWRAAVLEERADLAWVPPAVPVTTRPRGGQDGTALPIETHRARRARTRPRAREPAARERPHPHAVRTRRCRQDAPRAPARRPPSPTSSPTACAWSSWRRCATRAR